MKTILQVGDTVSTPAAAPTPSPLEVRPIRDIFELWQVYRLTHDCYVETDYIQPRPTGLLVHYAEFDHIPETTVLVALQDGEIVGSLSYTLDGPSGFIIEKDYQKECQAIRAETGRKLADYWRFVVKKSCRSGQQILMALMIHSGVDLLEKGVNTFFLDVHEKHEGAYKRMFGGVTVARRKGVPGLEQQHIAAVLIRWDAEKLSKIWWERMEKYAGRPISMPVTAVLPLPPVGKPGLENAKAMADLYEQRIQKARQDFNKSEVVQRLTSPDTSPEFIMLFLINYYAYDVRMNLQTESWSRRAGQRCKALGLQGCEDIFQMHAEQQANLHLLLSADVKALVSFWNRHFQAPTLNVEMLLSRPNPSGVLHYQDLHEEILAGNEPYRQFAMKYENDRLALEYGAWIVSRCVQSFGEDVLARLTFLQKKAVLEVEQTQFNWLELGKWLSAHPECLDGLGDGGVNALQAFQQVLEDCLQATRDMISQTAKAPYKTVTTQAQMGIAL